MVSNTDMSRKVRDPLQPFASLVGILAGLMALLTTTVIVFAVLGVGEVQVLGIGGPPSICIHDDTVFDSSVTEREVAQAGLVRPGVTSIMAGINHCVTHPTIWQRVLVTFTRTPSSLLFTGMVVLMWWLVRAARAGGPFGPSTVRRARALGWWLIVGGLVSAAVTAVAATLLRRTILTDESMTLAWPQIPWSELVAGLGLLTVARLLTVAISMREEIEATI